MARIKHGTLTPNTVASVALDSNFGAVEVLNRDGLFEIFVLMDSGATDPTVAGDDTECLPAAIGSIEVASLAEGSTTIKLISSGAAKYTVKGL
jgi:hypothetical protein